MNNYLKNKYGGSRAGMHIGIFLLVMFVIICIIGLTYIGFIFTNNIDKSDVDVEEEELI